MVERVPAGYNRALMEAAGKSVERFVIAGAVQIIQLIVRASTSHEGKAPGAPVDTGALRGSPRITLNSPSAEAFAKHGYYSLVGAAEVAAALKALRLGDVVWVRYVVPYANIIEGGRRKSKRGWWIGSVQAPDGYVHFAIDEAASVFVRWRYTA